MKEKNEHEKEIEVIFVSLDDSKEAYDEYVKDMPWLCVPFQIWEESTRGDAVKDNEAADATKKSAIFKDIYKVDSIPHLSILDGSSGRILKVEATADVIEDPDGLEFPWEQKSFDDLLSDDVMMHSNPSDVENEDAPKTAMSTLGDKYLMMFLSAQWCPPCDDFTYKIANVFDELKKTSLKDKFEMIFCSCDSDEEAFVEYYKKMPPGVLAIPYALRDIPDGLFRVFDSSLIPNLIMMGPKEESKGGARSIINSNVRTIIEEISLLSGGEAKANAITKSFPFQPKAYKDIAVEFEDIDEKKCLVIFNEYGSSEEKAKTLQVLEEVSSKLKETSNDEIHLYYAITSDNGVVSDLKASINCENHKESPLMVMLDFQDEGAYYVANEIEINVENTLEFIKNPGEREEITQDFGGEVDLEGYDDEEDED
eukprot:CAMPEP_0178948600 /NCGR_PEP_ID=MMETSP0789-20121207/5572_1 /TAXON_ID=3005 /ORGANISM="Rhizosolenia setigera, Strain CCMP 1694" /LENGTH=424 /DNA_ID=CAMNT_0020629003 /DNA_START=157 /DNA_END=1431 /DNA_ORIENTATION=-